MLATESCILRQLTFRNLEMKKSKTDIFSRRTVRGFTLVELLVVIAIIGVLVGLTIPAVQSVRSSARKTTCLNNQKQITVATRSFETSMGYLPYHMNSYAGTNGCWVVPLLPHMEQTALWNVWEQGNNGTRYATLSGLICPDQPEKKKKEAGISYVANCGYEGQENDGGGIMAFQLGAFVPSSSKRAMTAKMKDGTAYTVLFSENLNATDWKSTNRKQYGALWAKSRTTDAYPSSYHPQQGFNTAFADGSVRYLSRGIEYLLYCQIMAPDDQKASKFNSSLTNQMKAHLIDR